MWPSGSERQVYDTMVVIGILASHEGTTCQAVLDACKADLLPAKIGIVISNNKDSGLLSPELAAGIRRVKGAKRLGVRLGNWLTAEEARLLWQLPNTNGLKGKRDRAILAILLGCGLRRRELAELLLDQLQRREDHWAIVDLVGKEGHIRTVPVPDWVKRAIDQRVTAAGIKDGKLFRCVCRAGNSWGNGMTEKIVWRVVKENATRLGLRKVAPHDLRRSCARL